MNITVDIKTNFKNLLRVAGIVALLGAGTPADAQSWTNRYNGPGNNYDQANAIAVDGSGNVFVTGYAWSGGPVYATIAYSGAGAPLWTNYSGVGGANAIAVDGGGNVFVTGSGSAASDYVTIAYLGTGAPLWTNRYNGPGNNNDEARAIAVDGGGNVYVTGLSRGSGSLDDYATIAYSGAGSRLWTNRYNGPGNDGDFATAIAVDGSSNVFVTGTSWSSSFEDYATIAYSGKGVPLWTNRYNGPGNDSDVVFAIAVAGSGNVFVTGRSPGSGSSWDYATIAYSVAGVPLWTNRYNGPGNDSDQAYAIAVDGSGNVFVTGYSRSTGSLGSEDYATIAYSGAGTPLWTNRYNGTGNNYDQANAIAVDGSGNVYVTGYSRSTASSGSEDYATIAYSGAGVPLWTNRYSGPGNGFDFARAIAVDGSGNAFVTGNSPGSGSSEDYATIKYAAAAVPSVSLGWQVINQQLVLNWPNAAFSLQAAPSLTSGFTNVPGAISPYTNSLTEPQRHFRLISP